MNTALHVGIVVPAFFYVPYWAAHENGCYQELGLDVKFTVYGGIDPLTKALKTAQVDIGIGSPEHVIHDIEAGGELRMVGGNVNRLTHSLITQPEIKTLKDLRGKTLGVSALSGGTSSLFIDILEREGLRHPEDYTIVEAGVVPPATNAFSIGKSTPQCKQIRTTIWPKTLVSITSGRCLSGYPTFSSIP